VTPLLFAAMAGVAYAGLRRRLRGFHHVQLRYFALVGGTSTLLIFLFGFFTDVERISFHWPLPGYLALLVSVPLALNHWTRFWRRAVWVVASVGLVLAFAYYVMAATPSLREQTAGSKYYPRNFAGWQPLADAVRDELAQMPADTEVLAGSFKVGSELGFRLEDPSIRVLPHELNDRHGRTAQLALWHLISDGSRSTPQLLVLAPGDQRYRDLLERYHKVCELVGPLPPPRVVSLDHGFQRFLLFRLPAQKQLGPCVAPAMAWINTPEPAAVVNGAIEVQGWAFKDGVGRMCWWTAKRLLWPTMVRTTTSLASGKFPPTRTTRRSDSTPVLMVLCWRRAGIGWGCACMGAMAAWKTGRSSRSRFLRIDARDTLDQGSKTGVDAFRG